MWTGQRWEAPDRNFFGHRDCLVRNMSRYRFVAGRARGRCLDVGCGRGYGFAFLRTGCSSCTGLDASEAFLEEARREFPDITFVRQSAERLPFADASFETVTSFEVIEHLRDDRGFLAEIARVLAPGGLLAISTPNREIASGGRAKPLNRFHAREYVAAEFRELLEAQFRHVELYGQAEGMAGTEGRGWISSLLDRIPVRLKYLIPFYVQDVAGVLLRPPLQPEDCRFTLNEFAGAHTLYALCRV